MGDIRSEAVLRTQNVGIHIEKHRHEIATAVQGEIDIRYDTLTQTANNVMMYKYVLKNVAGSNGKVATVMPKPIFGDNGTDMHTHPSIWTRDTNLFYGEGYANMSEMFLLRGDVFTPDLMDIWLEHKRERGVDEMRLRPHPYEFFLYFDA